MCPTVGGEIARDETSLAESSGRMGRTRTGRTAGCLYGAEELEHTLALALSRVRAKVTADCTEGVCLELIPWDLGCGRHRELSLCAEADSGRERERSNREPLRNSTDALA
jgi:hypothetical protein